MPGLTIPSEATPSPRTSSAPSPSTPAQARRTSSSASTPQQAQAPTASSSPFPQSESPNQSSPASMSSPPPAHLAPTFTGSGTFYTPNFAADRPRFRHSQGAQEETDRIVPGAPEPIDFDSNPDVLALQSTMGILLMQRKRAAADMAKLKEAKEAALADTTGFVRDLQAGKVGKNTAKTAPVQRADDDDEDSSEDDEAVKDGKTDAKPWQSLPTPQNVARMPPINWDQYGVVGKSLERLHEEQRTRPSPGTPAVLTPRGTYEAGTPNPAQQGSPGRPTVGKEYRGPMAPFDPLVDKLEDKKSKEAPVTPRR